MDRRELEATRWDVAVVGGGHNGLTAAAYLARAGLRTVVCERRRVVGGAATIEEPWPGYRVSPCAYLAGLLHPRVIDDLGLDRHGLRITLLDPQMFVPIEPGISLVEWQDPERTAGELARWAPGEVEGWRAMSAFWDRVRDRLRPDGDDDLWLAEAPTREEISARLDGDPAALAALFDESVVENLGRFLADDRLVDALCSQGIIGTNASPLDPGTAFVRFHHMSGRLAGGSGDWGFVHGGIGMVSMALREAATEAGAVVVTDAEVARIHPGRGVELADGTTVAARAVVSNADPKRTLRLVEGDLPADLAARVAAWPTDGCSAKVNVALTGLPTFNDDPRSHAGQVDVGPGVDGLHAGHRTAREGGFAPPWAELYFQTVYDPSVAPEGRHVMSAFVQYVPHTWADGGSWDDHRAEVAEAVFEEIERWAPGFGELVEAWEVSGPPDIEEKVGLTGGHIFQGECLPEHMWDRRLPYRLAEGLYLCGAATHPGGSVIAVNGRNAAMRVLADLGGDSPYAS